MEELSVLPIGFFVKDFSRTSPTFTCSCFDLTFSVISTSFLQVDSFAASRDNDMHEATRRILSVILRQVRPFLHVVTVLINVLKTGPIDWTVNQSNSKEKTVFH